MEAATSLTRDAPAAIGISLGSLGSLDLNAPSMYVTTFYSFKGGVGRTMALANVAVDLARRGKRVLVVDFDLEAPGLDTFDLPRPTGPTPGVVDFVQHYLQSNQAPDVRAYLYESPGVGQDGGGLWIMPSGAPGETYAQRLAEIDWTDLYEHHDGYLLFEDLKLQWEEFIKPEYVFIDSRTGHTDVGGICTRQLPDAVVALFFPNKQNLRGLTKVVRDIRAEEMGSRSKAIRLHFVMSNVPDIDDENQILAEILDSFKGDLELEEDPMVIHRYQSLELLRQSIFTKDRPNSRLAEEYRKLVEAIGFNNLGDRDSAIRHLRSLHNKNGPTHGDDIDDDTGNLLVKIRKDHSSDGEVLFEIGQLLWSFGDHEAMDHFNRAIDLGFSRPEVYFSRIEIWLSDLDKPELAVKDAMRILAFPELSVDQVLEAVEILNWSPQSLEGLADYASIRSLPVGDQIQMAQGLNSSVSHAKSSYGILLSALSTLELSSAQQRVAQDSFILASMALGKCTDAVDYITARESDLNVMSANDSFNLGMATWGISDSIETKFFNHFLECSNSVSDDPLGGDPAPDKVQRRAIALWAVGQTKEAMQLAAGISQLWKRAYHFRFSYWRYLNVSNMEFHQDIEDLIALIDGNVDIKPRFMLPKHEATIELNNDASAELV